MSVGHLSLFVLALTCSTCHITCMANTTPHTLLQAVVAFSHLAMAVAPVAIFATVVALFPAMSLAGRRF